MAHPVYGFVITCIELGPTKRLAKRWRMPPPVLAWIAIRIGATKWSLLLEVDKYSMWSWEARWNPRWRWHLDCLHELGHLSSKGDSLTRLNLWNGEVCLGGCLCLWIDRHL